MRHIPKAYERYRHFKGNCYQVLAIARSSEDESEQVVYQALYPPFTIYVRPLSGFMSEVDRAKYPSAGQRYRFELIDESSDSAPAETEQTQTAKEPEKSEAAPDRLYTAEPETPLMPEQKMEKDADADGMIDEDVVAFLDADTYEQKMNIFSALHDRVTQEMLNTIAVSLDIEVDSGDLEERYRQIQNCLQTFQRYECNRLR